MAPPQCDRMTNTCENITFACFAMRAVKRKSRMFVLPSVANTGCARRRLGRARTSGRLDNIFADSLESAN